MLYNIGRTVTYSILGLLLGLIGSGFAVFGFQQMLSVILGALILLSVVLPKKYFTRFKLYQKLTGLFYLLRSRLSTLFSKNNLSSLFTIGLLNGLLPCGLVYMALTGAIASGKAFHGALFMAAFGLGTIPLMLSLSLFKNLISLKFRSGINKAMPYLISVMAILMIVRGLNLGIPYVSPAFEKESKTVTCCEKPDNKKVAAGGEKNCCHKK